MDISGIWGTGLRQLDFISASLSVQAPKGLLLQARYYYVIGVVSYLQSFPLFSIFNS